MAMLARRGFRPELGRPDLPFARDLTGEAAERLGELLGPLLVPPLPARAIQRRGDFAPGEANALLTAAQEKSLADALVGLGILVRHAARPLRSPPGDELRPDPGVYVARGAASPVGLRRGHRGGNSAPRPGRRSGRGRGAGGQAHLPELKSSPPNTSRGQVAAFFARVRRLRPDVAIFAYGHGAAAVGPGPPLSRPELGSGASGARRIERDLWALTPQP